VSQKSKTCFSTKLGINEALKIELKTEQVCYEMEQNGFPLDLVESNKQITQLQERADWVDTAVVSLIPPKPKQSGTVVTKIFKMNGEYTKQVADWMEETGLEVDGEFCRVAWTPINLGSPVQVNKWLLDNGWIPLEWNYQKDKRGKEIKDQYGKKTKTSPKITDESLDSLEALGPAGRMIAYRRKVVHKRNQLQGFIRNMREDGTVPSKVNTLGAATRRMTHSIIANVPAADKEGQFWKPMRKVFYSGHPDWVVVGNDASQIQIRGLVHYAAVVANDYSGIEAIKKADRGEAKDFHQVNGDTAGVSRRESKGIFYGYLFGAGVPKTATMLQKTVKETEAIRKKFQKAVPYVDQIVAHITQYYRIHGHITGLDGTKIYAESEHMLLVYLLQNFEAVFMKVALCYNHDRIKKAKLRAKFVTMQHDEFQYICHKDDAQQLCSILEKSMVDAGKFVGSKCPVFGGAEVGSSWYSTH
jgi:DNA polymerase I-like protein with 3'-5' exonuclease and polymerase domains